MGRGTSKRKIKEAKRLRRSGQSLPKSNRARSPPAWLNSMGGRLKESLSSSLPDYNWSREGGYICGENSGVEIECKYNGIQSGNKYNPDIGSLYIHAHTQREVTGEDILDQMGINGLEVSVAGGHSVSVKLPTRKPKSLLDESRVSDGHTNNVISRLADYLTNCE